MKLVCSIFNFKIKLSMSHRQITLKNKNNFPTYIWQSCTGELCMGNLQSHWMCRCAVLAQLCFKSCGNCLTTTAGIGGRAKCRNVLPYCRLASGIGKVTSGRAGVSHSCYRAHSCWRSGIWQYFVIIYISLVSKGSCWDQCTTE